MEVRKSALRPSNEREDALEEEIETVNCKLKSMEVRMNEIWWSHCIGIGTTGAGGSQGPYKCQKQGGRAPPPPKIGIDV